jgi:hypothetical protein
LFTQGTKEQVSFLSLSLSLSSSLSVISGVPLCFNLRDKGVEGDRESPLIPNSRKIACW